MSEVEIRTLTPTRHEVWASGKLVDFASTEPEARMMASKERGRLAHEAEVRSHQQERTILLDRIALLEEVIEGFHHRISEIDNAPA